jgi:hypothetical protein
MKKTVVKRQSLYIGLIILFIGVFIIIEIILNLCPPISRDALIHHLAIPKIWLKQKHIHPIPWSDFSWYPMNIQLLYAICLWIGNDNMPKYIHMLFGLACSYLIYGFIKSHLGKKWALLGFVMFFSLPMIVWLSTAAYVDLGMTFFSSASIIYYIKFQRENSNQLKYLIVSAIFIGMAMGSKYNALIVFFFINIAWIYISIKSKKNYDQSMAYGLTFFLIACLVASPWYIRNLIETGNPFYPLFNHFFHRFISTPSHPLYCSQLIAEPSVNAITLRHILFNETLLETLLIPVRMFFQGSDYQYQYFQGVLNPMMIIFIPFALIRRFRHQWMLFVLSFIVFYVYVAFFTTMHQIRYLLPIFPFMCILSVFGCHACFQMLDNSNIYFKIIRWCLVLTMGYLFFLNVQYLHHRFVEIDPIPYISGKETKEAYLKKHLSHYEVYAYINEKLPQESVVLTFFLGRRGYYLNCTYKHEPYFGIHLLQCMIKNAYSEKAFHAYIEKLNITHILVRKNLIEKHLSERYSPEERQLLNKRIQSHFKLIYYQNGYVLWQVKWH